MQLLSDLVNLKILVEEIKHFCKISSKVQGLKPISVNK